MEKEPKKIIKIETFQEFKDLAIQLAKNSENNKDTRASKITFNF